MGQMKSRAELSLVHLDDYLPEIVDRLASFEATVEQRPDGIVFDYAYGTAFLGTGRGRLAMELTAADADGLQRVRELVTVAVQIYAKDENPGIVWEGDLTGKSLATFRKMRVGSVKDVTPRMRRIRLEGDNLGRYGEFGGLHLRLLFPTPENPDPVWPIAGRNGLPLWPDEARRPVARVYTIRRLDVGAGWMDIDFVVHGAEDGCEGIGSAWAMKARPGDELGIIGPVGRPVREADWYVLGCDETGLPAASRILERMAPETRGAAFIEVADEAERQEIRHPEGVALTWIYRNGVHAGEHRELVDAVARVEWPSDVATFGWFAAEAEPARKLRDYWRNTLSYGRDRTLVAGYWRRGESGVMAG
jgi:NADPH-dependent ferric siderophore reductase